MIINNSIIKALLSTFVVCSTACTANFEDINTNPYDATKDQLEADAYNVSAALVGMQGWVLPVNVNAFQFTDCLLGGSFGGYLADSNDWLGRFATYNPQQHWIQVAFNDVIPKIFTNHTQLKATTEDPVALSIANIIRVAAIQRVTDIYGPIPYSKVGVDGNLTAPYDSQEDVYKKMFEELDEAIDLLTDHQTAALSANADKVYGGNVVKWIKFANSLKLRMAMRIVYADEALARAKAEESSNHVIGTMSVNNDNAYMSVTKNPFRTVMYEYNDGDSRISADITAYMNGYKDPRRMAYFTSSTFTDSYIENGFYGLRSGVATPRSYSALSYSNMNISEKESKLLWMNAAETAFLKAEAALRGWSIVGSAEEYYNKGIELSFEQWGISGSTDYMSDATSTPARYEDPIKYNSYTSGDISTITIKWDGLADMETNLERIITQKWIANFPLGLESWAEFRRTGYPRLMPAPQNNSGGTVKDLEMARRIQYPQSEYTENSKNLNVALELLGGPDNMGTRLWWDCKK